MDYLPSGKLSHNYGKSPFFMGKSTISMAIFNSYVELPEGIINHQLVMSPSVKSPLLKNIYIYKVTNIFSMVTLTINDITNRDLTNDLCFFKSFWLDDFTNGDSTNENQW